MEAWEIKAILDMSLVCLMILIPTGISTGLWLNRYNNCKKQQEMFVDNINKPISCRVKKKVVNKK